MEHDCVQMARICKIELAGMNDIYNYSEAISMFIFPSLLEESQGRNPNPQDSVGFHGWKINKFSAVDRSGSQWLRVPATCIFEPYTETS